MADSHCHLARRIIAMAPPATNPRLNDIDPDTVALDLASLFLAKATMLVSGLLSPAYGLAPLLTDQSSEDDLLRSTELYRALKRVSLYAVCGVELDAPLDDYIHRLLPLYLVLPQSREALGRPGSDDSSEEREPETQFGVVIAAARAREKLAAGRGLATAELAVLASIGRRQVQHLIDAGEIKGRLSTKEHREGPRGGAWVVPAKEAARWLEARGVRLMAHVHRS
jgi:hypothetical protein